MNKRMRKKHTCPHCERVFPCIIHKKYNKETRRAIRDSEIGEPFDSVEKLFEELEREDEKEK